VVTDGQRRSEHFVLGPSKQPLRASAPAGDIAVRVEHDDARIDRAVEDLVEPLGRKTDGRNHSRTYEETDPVTRGRTYHNARSTEEDRHTIGSVGRVAPWN
jgi:hypothetical protein